MKPQANGFGPLGWAGVVGGALSVITTTVYVATQDLHGRELVAVLIGAIVGAVFLVSVALVARAWLKSKEISGEG